jgi:hypothetical protein
MKAQEVANLFRLRLSFIRTARDAKNGYALKRIAPAAERKKTTR